MLNQQLQQKLQQKLSPQQIQLIRMLELSTLELEERVKHELEENPALEEGRDGSADDIDSADDRDNDSLSGQDNDVDDISLGDYMTEDDIPDYKLREMTDKAAKKEEIPFAIGESLNEYLLKQLGELDLPEKQQQIAEYIIGNIDDDGYLRRDLMAIADDLIFQSGLSVEETEVEAVLKVVQEFDPAGVAARDLQECLLLQLEKRLETKETKLAKEVLKDYFEEFTRKHYDKIIAGLDIEEEDLRKVMHEITSLDPKPCSSWGASMETAMSQIVPDFIVDSVNDELVISMNNKEVPDLRVSREYADMFKDYSENKENQTSKMKEAVLFVKQKLDAAQWFIEAVKQRQETLQRTMEAIVQLQEEFFLTGDESKLRPMILKDVAQKSGYDISTISRVSNSKYVQTNFGIYPLKFFFSESMQTDSGEEISTREVKKIIRESIEAEDKHAPLNDEELTDILKKKGYIISRRTVAKYRKQQNIPVARLRKEI